jgi:hypothetical protein
MIDTAEIPRTLSVLEATAPAGKALIIGRRFEEFRPPLYFYQRRSRGVVAWTPFMQKGAPFADVRLAKIFADFWEACDPSLRKSYLVLRDLSATELAMTNAEPHWIRRQESRVRPVSRTL